MGLRLPLRFSYLLGKARLRRKCLYFRDPVHGHAIAQLIEADVFVVDAFETHRVLELIEVPVLQVDQEQVGSPR
jgi:hypothetical protein